MIRSRSVWIAALLGGALFAGLSSAGDPAAPAKEAPAAEVSAVKAPQPVQVGEKAPDFELTDTQGKVHKLSTYLAEGKVVVLEWFNPDCPFVKKQHQKTRAMAETQAAAAKQGVVWLAVNSGAPGKQGNGLERNQKAVNEYRITYPVLLDESGVVGKAYGAKTTPNMFVIVEGKVVYAGAIDDRPDAEAPGETNYVTAALASAISQAPPEPGSRTDGVSYGPMTVVFRLPQRSIWAAPSIPTSI